MFTYIYSVFESDDKHKYNFIPNEEGKYEFTNRANEKIVLPLWNIKTLNLTPSVTDLGKVNKPFCNYLRLNFGDRILAEALNHLRRGDLFDWEYYPYESAFNLAISQAVALYLPYLTTHPIKEFKGDGWERYVDKLCIAVFVKRKHNIWTGILLKKCLELKYPWLDKFKISNYSIDYGDFDKHLVYLKVFDKKREKDKNVYIPLKAFIEGDVEAIKKYHTKYFTKYYSWSGGWGKDITKKDVLGWRKDNLDLLESDTFKEFCDCLTNKKEVEKTNKKQFVVTLHVSGTYKVVVECDEECGLEDLKEASIKAFEDADDLGELEDADIEDFVRYSSDEGEYEF